MKVNQLTNTQFANLAEKCGVRILKKMHFHIKEKKFVFDDYIIEGDFAALRQFAEEIAKLELHDV
jgi:metal-responsive CopG/Arc/MetJ family transcriptional regulator